MNPTILVPYALLAALALPAQAQPTAAQHEALKKCPNSREMALDASTANIYLLSVIRLRKQWDENVSMLEKGRVLDNSIMIEQSTSAMRRIGPEHDKALSTTTQHWQKALQIGNDCLAASGLPRTLESSVSLDIDGTIALGAYR